MHMCVCVFWRIVKHVRIHLNGPYLLLKIPHGCLKYETTIFKWQLLQAIHLCGQKKRCPCIYFPLQLAVILFFFYSENEKKFLNFC